MIYEINLRLLFAESVYVFWLFLSSDHSALYPTKPFWNSTQIKIHIWKRIKLQYQINQKNTNQHKNFNI